MGTALQHGGDGEGARCALCGALAVGPCARCRSPVCGDCCELTEGGTTVWAICTRCSARGGRSLRGGWVTVLMWLLLPTALLFAAVVLLSLLSAR